MKVIRVEKFQPKIKRNKKETPRRPSVHLRGNDWQALMQHDRLTGKMDLKSKEVIRDPGSVKRLLEAEMIDSHGKLTPEARKKCAALEEKLQNRPLLGAAALKPSDARKTARSPGKKDRNVIPALWAVLMKYDRKTGNLLKIDPRTGQFDKTSRSILRNPSIIQRLVEKKLILPGGWLTPVAQKGCIRIEKKINAREAKESAGPRASIKRKTKADPDPGSKSKDRSNLKPRSNDRPKPATLSARMSNSVGDLQVFFESLQHDATVAAAGSGSDSGHGFLEEEDWQGFFENLPDDTPEPLHPGTFFRYDWKDENDLQAYFENLPQHFPDSRVGVRSDRKSAKKESWQAGKLEGREAKLAHS